MSETPTGPADLLSYVLINREAELMVALEPPVTAAPKGLTAVIALHDGTAWAAGLMSSGAGDTGYTIPLVMSTVEGH
jgi:hypothetical protein